LDRYFYLHLKVLALKPRLLVIVFALLHTKLVVLS